MSRNLWIGVIVAVVVIVGFMVLRGQSAPSAPQVVNTPEPTPAMSNSVTVNLKPQNGSSESGTATLVEKDSKVVVTLDLTGAPAAVAQPAHIHVGACPDVGAVKYPLTSPTDGKSETTLDVTFDQLKSQLPLGINVHKSAAESNVYVSCGDLTF